MDDSVMSLQAGAAHDLGEIRAFSALVPTVPLTDCDILAAEAYGVPEEGIDPTLARTFPRIDEQPAVGSLRAIQRGTSRRERAQI
jgi:hypothetical protein